MRNSKVLLLQVLHLAESELQPSFQSALDDLSSPAIVQCQNDQLRLPTSNLMAAIFSYRHVLAAILQHFQHHYCTVPRTYRPLCQLLLFVLIFGLDVVPVEVVRRFVVRHRLRRCGFVRHIFEMVVGETQFLSTLLERFYDHDYVECVIMEIVKERPELIKLLSELKDDHRNEAEGNILLKQPSKTQDGAFLRKQRRRLPPFIHVTIPNNETLLAPNPGSSSKHGMGSRSIPSKTPSSRVAGSGRKTKSLLSGNDRKHWVESDRSFVGSFQRLYGSVFTQHLAGKDMTLLKTKMFRKRVASNLKPTQPAVSNGLEDSTKQMRFKLLDEIRHQRECEIQSKRKQNLQWKERYHTQRDELTDFMRRRFDPTLPSQGGGRQMQMSYFELKQKLLFQKQLDALRDRHRFELVQSARLNRKPDPSNINRLGICGSARAC